MARATPHTDVPSLSIFATQHCTSSNKTRCDGQSNNSSNNATSRIEVEEKQGTADPNNVAHCEQQASALPAPIARASRLVALLEVD